MNIVIFGYYGFKDGYLAYGKHFTTSFATVSFFPLIEFRDKMNANQTNFLDIDGIINGNFTNKNKYTDYLINHDVPKDVVIIAHNNDTIENLIINDIKVLDYIYNLKKKYNFKLFQINWDASLSPNPPSKYFDISFCADPMYLKNHSNTDIFPQGFSDDTSFYEFDENYQCDISFIGTNLYSDSNFPNQTLNRKQILDKIYEDSSISLNIYGTPNLKSYYPNAYKGFIEYDKCYKVFSNSKLNLNISPMNDIEYNNHFYYSERLPQILACNGIMVSNNLFTPLLIPDVHYIYIDNIDNLLPKIKSILADNQKMENIKKNILKIKDKFNYKYIIPKISNKIINSFNKFVYFLLDYSYNISHILCKFIDKPIELIYITYNNNINHKNNLYLQESVLKHIYKHNFNVSIKFVPESNLPQLFKKNYIFLNTPLHYMNEIDYNYINIKNIYENDYELKSNKINLLQNIGHGIDEEYIIYKFIENKFEINDNIIKIIKKNNSSICKFIPDVINFDNKSKLFSSIYHLDPSKKTILFCDNYLYPFLTNKDKNNDPYSYTICNKIIDQLILLKKDFNVILRFHPFNEQGIRVGKEFPDKVMDNFIIDFTPFELPIIHNNVDYVISNRYTSTGLEAILSKCQNILFIDYNLDERKLPNNYLAELTNSKFEILLESGYIINNDMIPVIRDDKLDLLDIIYNNKFYKNVDNYIKLYFN